MTDHTPAAQAADTNPLSDEYVNAVIQQHGYDSPECVIARLHQWIGLHGGENGVTLLMYEAHKALVKLRAPVAATGTYVEARECAGCGHVGINDSSSTLAACNMCGWSGDSPTKDHCPGCEQDGTITAACPECGEKYALLADRMLDIASAPVAGEAQPSDIDILGLAGQYIQPSPVDVAPQIVNFSRALLSRYAAPQASTADAAALSTAVDYRRMEEAPEVSAHVVATFDKLRVDPILQFKADKLWVAGHSIQGSAQAAQPGAPASASAKDTAQASMAVQLDVPASSMLELFLSALPEIQATIRANHELRAALILARDSHGVSLLTDPPQDAWKARRVDEAIRAALSAQPEQS